MECLSPGRQHRNWRTQSRTLIFATRISIAPIRRPFVILDDPSSSKAEITCGQAGYILRARQLRSAGKTATFSAGAMATLIRRSVATATPKQRWPAI